MSARSLANRLGLRYEKTLALLHHARAAVGITSQLSRRVTIFTLRVECAGDVANIAVAAAFYSGVRAAVLREVRERITPEMIRVVDTFAAWVVGEPIRTSRNRRSRVAVGWGC